MFTTLRNAWKIPDLRKKLLFTLLILVIYRLGNCITVPFVNTSLLADAFEALSTTILGLYDAMSGSAFSTATVFALSIQPYINASIIIQLLTIAIPSLERLAKEGGEEGKKKIAQITRYTTIGLGLVMGIAYYIMLLNYTTGGSYAILSNTGFGAAVVIVLSFLAGSAFVMWLGEQITEFGIGNGISIILFANIISRIPSGASTMISGVMGGSLAWYGAILLVVGILALMALIIFVNNSERRIPVQYAKRMVGRKMYGGQNTHLPIKVNMSGVLPIIFAQSIASLPATFGMFFGMNTEGFWYKYVFSNMSAIYAIAYFLLIIAFSYFYATVQYNPIEIANNLQKNGGFIPGFRPGKPTANFIAKVINKITFFGALYLGIVAVMPIIVGAVFNMPNLSIGGTSVIIVCSVALETVAAMEAQMLMRHYKGFLE